jgi:hypothetical protein
VWLLNVCCSRFILNQGVNYSAVYLNMFLPLPDERGTLTQYVRIGEGIFDIIWEVVSRGHDVSISVIHMSRVSSVSIVSRPHIMRLVFDSVWRQGFFTLTGRSDRVWNPLSHCVRTLEDPVLPEHEAIHSHPSNTKIKIRGCKPPFLHSSLLCGA